MVTAKLSRTIWVMWLTMLVSIACLPSPGLATGITPTLIHGESLQLTLRSDNTHAEFDRMDLTPLRAHFHIEVRYPAVDRVRLTLTPYQPGLIETPALRSGTLQLPAQRLEVVANPAMALDWSVAPEQGWLGDWWSQQVDITLVDEALSLNVHMPHMPGLEAAPMARLSNQQARLQWAQRLDETGSFQRSAPSIRVATRQGGVWAFYAPPQVLKVQARPSYIPPSLPSGPVAWQWQRPKLMISGRVYELRTEWAALASDHLPPLGNLLQQQLRANLVDVEWLFQRREQTVEWQAEGRTLIHQWVQPFRLEGIQWGYYAPVDWLYFDRHSQQLQQKTLEPQWFIALPLWLWLTLMALVLAAGLVVFSLLVWLVWGIYNRASLWRIVHRLVTKTAEARVTWLALLAWSQRVNMGRPASQQAWLDAYQQRYNRVCPYQAQILALRPWLFAPQTDSQRPNQLK
jgi:hypothetical protein